MTEEEQLPESSGSASRDLAARIYRWLTGLFVLVMLVEFGVLVIEGQRMPAVLVAVIIAIIVAPFLLRHRLPVEIPAEFQLLAAIFLFATLFLGEIQGYYSRIWWWDIILHANSGLLLGIIGFLLVYVLNESEHMEMYLQPRFVAAFAFLFAVAMGTFWEIFEFAMDQLFGMEMQKALVGDATGLTDTMWDLIVDTIGAAIISVFGWWYLKREQDSFIASWIEKFIEKNPRLFQRGPGVDVDQ